jgi:hypothetical protein
MRTPRSPRLHGAEVLVVSAGAFAQPLWLAAGNEVT